METKVCKECERELPETSFMMNRWGKRNDICNECRNAKRKETISSKTMVSVSTPYNDVMFDDMQPVDVIKIMTRAKRWLESRGYEITLRGSYTIRKEVKFNEL